MDDVNSPVLLDAKTWWGKILQGTLYAFLFPSLLCITLVFIAAMFGLPIIIGQTDHNHYEHASFWLESAAWWVYIAGSFAAIARYEARNSDDGDMDPMPIICFIGSWLAWRILAKHPQA